MTGVQDRPVVERHPFGNIKNGDGHSRLPDAQAAVIRAGRFGYSKTWTSYPEVTRAGHSGKATATATCRKPSLAIRTPRPWTLLLEAGLLACGSKHLLSPSRGIYSSVAYAEQMLAAHSCGGSYGLATIMVADHIPILASNPCESKEPRTLHIVDEVKFASTGSVMDPSFKMLKACAKVLIDVVNGMILKPTLQWSRL